MTNYKAKLSGKQWKRTHWVAPIAGTFFIRAGIYYVNLVTHVYLADAFTIYAESAASAESCLRSVFGCSTARRTAAVCVAGDGVVECAAVVCGGGFCAVFVFADSVRAED